MKHEQDPIDAVFRKKTTTRCVDRRPNDCCFRVPERPVEKAPDIRSELITRPVDLSGIWASDMP
jgi:hypothetical protein